MNRGERGRTRRRKRFRDMENGMLMFGLLEGVFLESIAILDEEIDEGGGEAGLDDEGGGAGGGLEIGDDSGNSIGLGLLPWERHGCRMD